MPVSVELLRLYPLPVLKHPAMHTRSIVSYNQSSMPPSLSSHSFLFSTPLFPPSSVSSVSSPLFPSPHLPSPSPPSPFPRPLPTPLRQQTQTPAYSSDTYPPSPHTPPSLALRCSRTACIRRARLFPFGRRSMARRGGLAAGGRGKGERRGVGREGASLP